MSRKSNLKGIGIQFFAEPSDPKTDPNPNPTDPNPKEPEPKEDPPKTFTQEEVNRMLSNEKRQGKNSILKDLGLDPNDKDAVKKVKEILDAQKTQKEKDDEALRTEKEARLEAERKATLAEQKIALLDAGCKVEYIEEVTAVVNSKVTDSKDFEMALKEVKEKFPNMFACDDPGTGGSQGHKRGNPKEKVGTLGTRLAQGMSTKIENNPYFNN